MQVSSQVGSSLIPELAILLQRLVDCFFQLEWHLRIDAAGGNRGAGQNSVGDDSGGVARERLPASGHFIEHQTETENVRACVQFLATDLLWRHVAQSSWSRAGFGELICGGGCRRDRAVFLRPELRQSEVQDFGLTTGGYEDVRRLDVAMNDPFGMRSL